MTDASRWLNSLFLSDDGATFTHFSTSSPTLQKEKQKCSVITRQLRLYNILTSHNTFSCVYL